MSIFSFVTAKNMELYFFKHLEECPDCNKVHQDGYADMCDLGLELYTHYKRAMREEAA